jgi:AraC-like DNA-binding protein
MRKPIAGSVAKVTKTRDAVSGASAFSEHDKAALRAQFFAQMGGWQQFQKLFNHMPDVHFFAKDRDGRFIAGSAGLLRRLGIASEDELIGLTDGDIHPARVAKEIREDDSYVMTTRQPLIDRIEALFIRSQAKDWYSTTKLPILDVSGEVIGIMGFVRPYREVDRKMPGMERLERVVAYIHENHSGHIAAEDLAKIACLSVRQLHRLFHKVFGMNTQTFIVRTRVQAASDDLLLTHKSMSEIALDHGFCDQSAFSRRFLEHTGETPLRFRKRLRIRGTSGV